MLRILVCALVIPTCIGAQTVEVRDNSFFIDGEKFFIKGIGYEIGATPGHYPWERTFDPDLLRFDIERILSGGFNTIRTWAPFTEQELAVLSEYDLKIIMGIWIDPAADFSDPGFVNSAKGIVSDVLDYSPNYDNIIAYLIMNEPKPEIIAAAGYDATVSLWAALTDIIHAQHPGRPVSIANTSNGTYIDPAVFDYAAYNVYPYNPVTVNHLHRYRAFIDYLESLGPDGQPTIVTEYGLSVSPDGPGGWGYGGNSLEEQQEGILHMYQALVDGGAAGSCVFNYSDGWWKAGDAFVHDPHAEEWFGLVEYADLEDQHGQTRPVWEAVRAYQSAIIAQPRSGEIYGTLVPVEIFVDDTIERIDIILGGEVLVQYTHGASYVQDTLHVPAGETQDVQLEFVGYDGDGQQVKREVKSILIAPQGITLPTIDIAIENPDFWNEGVITVRYEVHQSPNLTAAPTLEHVFYPHYGFDYGVPYQRPLQGEDPFVFTATHSFGDHVPVITVGAAFDVSFGDFQTRVVNQKTVSRIEGLMTSTDQIPRTDPSSVIIAPNPASDYIRITPEVSSSVTTFDYTVFDIAGGAILSGQNASWTEPLDISSLVPGVYLMHIIDEDLTTREILRLVKQ